MIAVRRGLQSPMSLHGQLIRLLIFSGIYCDEVREDDHTTYQVACLLDALLRYDQVACERGPKKLSVSFGSAFTFFPLSLSLFFVYRYLDDNLILLGI